jgi:DNA-binding SARP family transcriptional activator/tetratricopeptide (TPR) repeat protein
MIHVHTLGASRIDAGRSRVKPTSVRKFAMLLHLSAEHGRPVPRAALQELIFPDQSERNAQHSLRELVYQLRQSGVHIESDGSAVSLTDAVRCDYSELIARERPDDVQLKAVEGGFLPGYAPAHSEAFAEWFDGYRARAIFDLTKALLKEVQRARSVADWGATERAARACLTLDPLNEEATLTLAEVLAIGGSKAKAVKLLDDYMAEVGTSSAELRVPAGVLKRRIAERVPDSYRPASTLTFVGREEEMLLARQCFERARAGERQCLVIGGEPGIGKSRLAAELQNSILLGGAETRRVTMQPHDARRPLSVFMELVPQLLQMRGAIGCSPESLQLLKRLTERQEEDLATDTRAEELNYVSAALVNSIRDLIEALTAEGCLALFVDDAHWIDPHSLEVLIDLSQTRGRARLLIALTTRDHRSLTDRCAALDHLVVLPLRPLPDPTVGKMVDELCSTLAEIPPEVIRHRIIATASGNPLFAILLAGQVADGMPADPPNTLTDALARRIGAVDTTSHSVLVACHALGRHCTLDRLIRSLEMPHFELLNSLNRLSSAGLIRSETNTLLFAHPLIAEALREQSEPAIVRAASHRAADILEQEAADQHSSTLYWESAERWLVAGNYKRAYDSLRECARHALALGRPNDAVATLQKASELPVPEIAVIQSLRELLVAADLALDAPKVLAVAGQLERLGAFSGHDELEHALMRARFTMADVPSSIGDQLLSCAHAKSASPEHRVWAATWLLKFAHIVGRYELLEVAKRIRQEQPVDQVPRLLGLEFDLIYYSAMEDDERAIETAREMALVSAERPKAAWLVPQQNIGLALWRAGATDEALGVFSAAFEAAEAIGSRMQQLRLACALSTLLADLGDDEACATWIARARALASDDESTRPAFNFFTLEVDLALSGGDVNRAVDTLARMERVGLLNESYMRASWRVPAELRLRVAQGSVSEGDELIAREMAANLRPTMTGVNDFEVTALCEVLLARGKSSEAREMLRDYVEGKRIGSHPLSRSLQIVAGRLKARMQ